MYIGYVFPFTPTMVILGQTLDITLYKNLNIAFAWGALLLSIPIYFGLYVYLD